MDWLLLVLILAFAIRGYVRGTIAQVFALAGLIAGLWVAGRVLQWVGAHWHGARPAVLFWALRWLVAALAGLAVASLFAWWAELLAKAVKSGPAAWLDRAGGIAVGAGIGVMVSAVALLILMGTPWLRDVSGPAEHARISIPLMSGGARACAMGEAYFPGGGWLKKRFLSAEHRARHAVHS